MNEKQKEAIKANMETLTEVFLHSIDSFFIRLRFANVINADERAKFRRNSCPREMLIDLFELLQQKDSAWGVIIAYLTKNDQLQFAKTLSVAADEVMPSTSEQIATAASTCDFQQTRFISEFKDRLADHYKTEYSRVPTVFGHSKHIERVWVPLKIDETTEFPKISEEHSGFDHLELLARLKDPENPHVALLKGHPGVGKSTLVKKICYDWANGNIDIYCLVLAVPLRHVDSGKDLLQMAVDYYGHKFRLSAGTKIELLSALMQLGRHILICFDGLDEYSKLSESPFKSLFGSQLEDWEIYTSHSPPMTFYCQLLITSRPYACDRINQDFYPLRFEISPLNEAHLKEFVRLYCTTQKGIAKVTKYLKVNADLVIKVPLILTCVCFLADTKEEIPKKLTLLYDRLLRLMMRREIDGNKRTGKISLDRWKNSKFLYSTLQLAFEGCKENTFEFSESLQKALCVSKDSFTYGFLLQKFDFSEGSLTAEFPHRSIQEFFAAVHCYHLTGIPDTTERNSVMKEILNDDSQFGRFFFGICSDEKRFEQMLEWLNPTFQDAEMTHIFSFDPSQLIFLLPVSLCDCSERDAKLLGQILAVSLNQLEKKIKTERNKKINLFPVEDLSSLNKSFLSGLNLNFLDEKKKCPSWSLTHSDKPRLSRLTYVFQDLIVNLQEKFNRVQIFMWRWHISDLAEMIASLDRLPPVSTLIIQVGLDLEVNFALDYEKTTTVTKSANELRHFTFCFDKVDSLRLKCSFPDQSEADDFIARETKKTGEEKEISWVTVVIRANFDQTDLVGKLIKFAVGVPFAPQKFVETSMEPERTKKNDKKDCCDLM